MGSIQELKREESDMSGALSLFLGIAFGISLIYIIFPILTDKNPNKNTTREREEEAKSKEIKEEIEKLKEELLVGKILKEDYDLLLERLQKEFKETSEDNAIG